MSYKNFIDSNIGKYSDMDHILLYCGGKESAYLSIDSKYWYITFYRENKYNLMVKQPNSKFGFDIIDCEIERFWRKPKLKTYFLFNNTVGKIPINIEFNDIIIKRLNEFKETIIK